MILSKAKKLLSLISSSDIRFLLFEKFSLTIGIINIYTAKIIYGKRLEVGLNSKVWGRIRFLMLGSGAIKIGDNFHCVSNRKRSVFTLFSPTHLSIIGCGQIEIGDHVGLNGTTIVARDKISIGDNTMIGPNTIIVDHDGHAAWPIEDRWTKQGPFKEVIIENDVWIGMNCMILKGVRIGSGAIIAGGSVVISSVDSNSVYAGNPARKVKTLGD